MRWKGALRVLAEITAYQWGMVTSAQASMHGVTRLDLSRLTADRLLERLAHGVYKTTVTPSDRLDRLRAAWLSTDPKRLAHERRATDSDAVVFAGASAALIHGIGDLWDEQFDFISPVRRQTQRREVRYRKRLLDPRDVTTVDGLPVLSVGATIADLVEVVGDLSLVADAVRNAARADQLPVPEPLAENLSPVATRRKTTGQALARELFELAEVRPNMSGYDFSVPNSVPPRGPLTGPTGRRVVEHRQELLDVLARHGVTNPEVFGSAARGDDREESDLDLLVDFAPGTDLFDMVRIKAELEEVLGAPVDLIPRDGLKERVRSAAAADLVPL
jgi:predicted nucleotidyltransferase